MTFSTKFTKSTSSKSDMYQEVTDTICTALEHGIVPWNEPLIVKNLAPVNLVTGKAYRGANRILLGMMSSKIFGGCHYWLTLKQANSLKARVNKGEHGTRVIFWKMVEVEEDDLETSGKEVPNKFGIIKHYTCFNARQCTGLELPMEEERIATCHEKIEAAEAIVSNMPNRPTISHEEINKAYYNRTKDLVNVPGMEHYVSAEEYYSALFHELSHSTGHVSRLGRCQEHITDRDEYSKEELTAELSAAFLCAECGILPTTIKNHEAYIQAYLGLLRNDKKFFVQAAAAAQRASDYILNAACAD